MPKVLIGHRHPPREVPTLPASEDVVKALGLKKGSACWHST